MARGRLRRTGTGAGKPLVAAAASAVMIASLLVPGSGAAALEADGFPVQLVRVATPTYADRDLLTNLGLDLTEHGGDDYVDVVLHSAADAARLAQSGLDRTVLIDDLGRREVENRLANEAYAAATAASPLPSGRDVYRHLADYEAELDLLANEHPGHVRLLALPRNSLEGRPIRGVEISRDVESATDGKPVFLLLGLHHAREWPSGEHSMEFAYDLAQGLASGDARISGLLDRARVIVVPVVNPDGFEQSRKWGDLADLRELDDGDTVSILATPGNAYKRKNCRAVDGQVPPAGACELASPGGYGLGVDLNRNYGGRWGGDGASDLFADPTYRGAGPFSEPEAQAVRELVSARHVTLLISNHTFGNLILRPPAIRAAGTTVDEAAMKELGALMAANNGYRNLQSWQLYDTSGTTDDWSYGATGGYGYTFEIGTEFHPPFEEVVEQYLGSGVFAGKGNREAFLVALEHAADAAHHSIIAGRAPTGAVLRLQKSFATPTSQVGPDGEPAVIEDNLDSTLTVGPRNRFTWHVNPSTRPDVMEHRVGLLAEEPIRTQSWEETPVWTPETVGSVTGAPSHVDLPFSMPEDDVAALRVTLDWPTPDDLDLYVYQVQADGSLLEVASSGNFVLDKEEALVELPDPGEYVIRVVNFASVAPSFTATAALFGSAGEEIVSEGGLIESYTLSCARPDGTVLERRSVTVDRGETQRVALRECLDAF